MSRNQKQVRGWAAMWIWRGESIAGVAGDKTLMWHHICSLMELSKETQKLGTEREGQGRSEGQQGSDNARSWGPW